MSNKLKQEKIREHNGTKYIFVVGGVMSGVGKGVTAASIALVLQSYGFKVSAIKMDPYVNVDAGTMNPIEHGEVFVTEDGDETDQDIGNYERFLNTTIYKENYMTTGRIYQSVIEKERNLAYRGKCVQVVPHIPIEIRERILKAVSKTKAEIMIIEIGGTVGEYENLIFLEAARVLKLYKPKDVLFVMVSYLPVPNKIGEMKTKPTQHAVKSLNTAGIQPDFIVARSDKPIDLSRKEKISVNCNIPLDNVIAAPDVSSIYDVPINFEKEKIGLQILKALNLNSKYKEADIKKWKKMTSSIKSSECAVDIAIVGKYFKTGDYSLTDSYISVIEALKHAGAYNNCKINLHWLNTEDIENNGIDNLKNYSGFVVPQGWGKRGSEGKIKVIKYCRENNVPYFGLCYGMQMAVIEFARNVLGREKANSEEIDPKSPDLVIHFMPEQASLIAEKGYGGTIRLGAWPCKLKENSRLKKAYTKFKDSDIVLERHRHRYEFNNEYRDLLESKGLTISGISPDGKIVEAIEISNHPFFIGVQFHPEYISRPLDPHPLFVEFISICKKRSK